MGCLYIYIYIYIYYINTYIYILKIFENGVKVIIYKQHWEIVVIYTYNRNIYVYDMFFGVTENAAFSHLNQKMISCSGFFMVPCESFLWRSRSKLCLLEQ
jgi:hypothetical protein